MAFGSTAPPHGYLRTALLQKEVSCPSFQPQGGSLTPIDNDELNSAKVWQKMLSIDSSRKRSKFAYHHDD